MASSEVPANLGGSNLDGSEIAVIGMACRFPGARNVEEFWRNLRDGVESITRLSDDELARQGVPAGLLARPNYVKAAPVIEGYDRFDADFFGYGALEARLMDPQQRLLLESAFAALESAGYTPESYDAPIGVFAGSKTNTYLFHLASRPELLQGEDFLQLVLGGDQAMVSTRISFKLGLKGPSYGVQTACSTSLVAVHLACQSLQLDECRMALAGGVALDVPHGVGYLSEEGGILSPDGRCRPFDAGAKGTVFGSGVGMVVLKRLEDALADGDHVSAVILGSATNNDGSDKATFTAPSVTGQTAVILDALAFSGVEADTLSYVEAHGTGTELGDPIEVLALSDAFRASTAAKGFCALGSVKANVGHLDAAAGMASLIKTVLALEHGELPPTLHFEQPNPRIDFENSPFFVADRRRPWPRGQAPRRAGVSSLGFGGTNAHVILQEAPATTPELEAPEPARPDQLLVLSARSAAALERASDRLASHLEETGDPRLADAAYTLQVGRREFDHRRVVVASDGAEAVRALRQDDGSGRLTGQRREGGARALFLFPGQGSQYVGMGRGLYSTEEVFRRQVDRCTELLEPHLGCDLRRLLYPPEGESEAAAEKLRQTAVTQPALFVVEHALASLWMSWGIRPQAMIGHSIGEYVAACLAGVFSLEDALALVAERGRLMQRLPGGAMLAVRLAEEELASELPSELSLAAVNGPLRSVVSGPCEAVAAFAEKLAAREVDSRKLHTSHAFHSAAMDPLLEPFAERVGEVALRAPDLPYASNLTGTWITAGEATDPGYWAQHLRGAVRFGDGLAVVLKEDGTVPIEVGPGTSLATFVREHPARPESVTLPSLPHPNDARSDTELLLGSLGKLWIAGMEIDWPGFHGGATRRRVPLPTYPFEGRRHWIDLASAAPEVPEAPRLTLERQADPGDWLYRPRWTPAELSATPELPADGGPWLLFCDPGGLGEALAEELEHRGQTVIRARIGDDYRDGDGDIFHLRPDEPGDYDRLFAALAEADRSPARIVHLWSAGEAPAPDAERYDLLQARGFYSLLFLLQTLGRRENATAVELTAVSTGVQPVLGDEELVPARATLLGPVKVAPKELANLTSRSVDLPADALARTGDAIWRERLVTELSVGDEPVVAWRGDERWVESFTPAGEEAAERQPITLRPQGVYLITGGLGGVGSTLGEHLAREARARLVLTARGELPPRSDWPELLAGADADDPVAGKIRRVERLEELGAEVQVEAADAADREAMARVIAATEQRFGAIDGVIHAAGVAGGGLLQLKTAAEAARVIDPKVRGALVLDELLGAGELDFLLLVSSLQTVLADFGQVDYCGANAFLGVFAEQQAARERPVVSIDWDNWSDLGILVNSELPPHLESWREELLSKAIAPSEAIEILRRVLARPAPRWVVSAQELGERIELSRSFTSSSILEQLGGEDPAAGPARAVSAASLPRGGELERRVAEVWKRVLELPEIGVHDNFFDLGGESLTGMRLVSELNRELGVELSPVQLYELPTVAALAAHLSPGESAAVEVAAAPQERDGSARIAVIGMAGRFPGAGDVDELWRNLCAGTESIRFFTDEELVEAGIDRQLLQRPNYVKARAVIDGAELFDADFFGCTPREAEVMDPQHRLFLECAWQALEDAGYDPAGGRGAVGVYAGSSISTYLQNLYSRPDLIRELGDFQAMLANEKDSLPTRVSYKLNLTGPSLAIQTYCSTSLVAVHLACQGLRHGECDLALAGGASINVPQTSGYLFDEGSFLSGDGHVRTFDAASEGIVFGDGLGVVVLKRLEDALADGDEIEAVIAGSAINNDGSLKAGFVAPSIDGQAQVIRAALDDAAVSAETIGYVEAHGTGTPLGDPIEIAALTKAYRADTDRKGYCPIGSVKTNFGHLDRAAGIASLIKTVLALRHRRIPPSLHFETPNPKIDFASSPFHVHTELAEWQGNGAPRRAAVSSLGIGGTNAHVILEQAPERDEPERDEPEPAGREAQLIVLSARTAGALERATTRLADFLESHPDQELADVAFTLQVGRRPFEHRRMLVADSRQQASQALSSGDDPRVRSATVASGTRRIVFLFPGLGAQYVDMALGLYRAEAVFRQEVDRCCELLEPVLETDLRGVLFPRGTEAGAPAGGNGNGDGGGGGVDLRRMLGRGGGEEDAGAARLTETRYSQPAVFVVEYALSRLWMSWGIVPEATVGYSIGELVAACLAGVLNLEDALTLVGRRAQLIHQLDAGSMLAVSLAEAQVEPYLDAEISLSGINAPEQSVLAGPVAAIDALETRLVAGGVSCRRLQTTHAFHSRMMEPCFEPLAELVRGFELQPPRIPYLSNVTGDWITAEEATDPVYWARHMCRPVRFSDAVSKLRQDPERLYLEVGPGQTLMSLVLQHPAAVAAGGTGRPPTAVASLRHAYETSSDVDFLLAALGKLWLAGAEVDWHGFHHGEDRRRISLPTYPFERRRYWIEPGARRQVASERSGERPRPRQGTALRREGTYLLLGDRDSLPASLARHLAADTAARLAWIGSEPEAGGEEIGALEELGAEVLPLACDLGSERQLRGAVERAYGCFGLIHGLIWVADLPPAADGDDLELLPRWARRLDAIAAAVGDEPFDFALLVTSSDASQPVAAAWQRYLETWVDRRPGGVDVPEWRHDRPRELAADPEAAEPATPEWAWSDLFTFGESRPGVAEDWREAAEPAAEDPGSRPAGVGYAQPEGEVEQRIAVLWQELLGISPVGRHDNFLEIGGDSLLATRLIGRMREEFGVELPVRLFFEGSTIAELGQKLRRLVARESGAATPEATIPRRPAGTVPPPSLTQERLWFIDQLDPGSPAYNVSAAVRLLGRLDRRVLERCFHELIGRHESLRTSFVEEAGSPRQKIAPGLEIELPCVDLGGLSEERREREIARLATASNHRRFDLGRGALLRITLLRAGRQTHVAVLTIHHIVCDTWSINLLVGELAALYEARMTHQPSPLSELPIQMADYAVWQREALSGESMAAELAYWLQTLDGFSGFLTLPTDRPRPPIQSYWGARRSLRLPAPLSREARDLSRRWGASLYMTLLAAYGAMLGRTANQDDLAVGVPLANRDRPEFERLIGPILNTVLMRLDLAGNPTFEELIGRVKESVLGAFGHQDYPFDRLVDELQPERDMGRNALFQADFILQNAPRTELRGPDLTFRPLDVETGTVQLDLSLQLTEMPEGLVGWLEYDDDLFDATTIHRFVTHFTRYLAGAVADPTRRLADIPRLSPAESHQIAHEWSLGAGWSGGQGPAAVSVLDRFEAEAEAHPSTEALVSGSERLSYLELNRRANRLARHLCRLGVGPGGHVGLYLPRGVEAVVAVLACWKAGAAYVPGDAAYGPERLPFIDREIRPPVWLTLAELAASLPESRGRVVEIDTRWPEISRLDGADLDAAADIDRPAYTLYTSGSTGLPKGVTVSHRHLADAYRGWEEAYRLRSEVRTHMQMASLSFDVFAGDLVRALGSGGRLVLCPKDLLLDAEALVELIRREEVDAAEFVPAVVGNLRQQLERTESRLEGMRLLVVGSDAWSIGELEALRDRAGPGTRVINSYGVTEATIDSSFCEAVPRGLDSERVVPIGRPFGGSELHLLDRDLRPVPAGVHGELTIGGAGVARGYLGRPRRTAAQYTPHPGAREPGARLYRTGDLARWLADGNVEFLGRIDRQVKIRGFRIELGEIEAVLRDRPGVGEAAVVTFEPRPKDVRLAAYLQPAGDLGTVIEDRELRAHLASRLPDYMIPAVFVTLDALPLTASGKVDRRRLPAPRSDAVENADTLSARNPTEELLAGVWCELLDVESLGVEDNLFERGAHSLLATQAMSRIRDLFRITLPVRAVFEEPTVAGLARRIDEALAEHRGEVELDPIEPAPRDRPLPLSFTQERMWFLEQFTPGMSAYNVPGAVHLEGELDFPVLERSLTEIVRRHEIFRTTFEVLDGSPVQMIAPPAPFTVPVVDLGALTADQRQTAGRRLIDEAARRSFDLARGPMLRIFLIRHASDHHVLSMTTHHVTYDMWARELFIDEIALLYGAFTASPEARTAPCPLPELPLQFADFAVWQRRWMQGEVLAGQLEFWKRKLSGIPDALELPTDRPRPSAQTYDGDRRHFEVEESVAEALRGQGQRSGFTPFMVLLAAFQTLLLRYSGQRRLVVGMPIANRNRSDTENLIGFFANSLALAAELPAGLRFRELLEQVRDTTLEAYANQDLPFEFLVEEIQPERDLSRHPIFQVMFNYLPDYGTTRIEMKDLSLTFEDVHNAGSAFELFVSMWPHGDGFRGSIYYSTALFDATTIDRLGGHLKGLLAAVAAEPDTSVDALRLLSAGERHQLLGEWNDTRTVADPGPGLERRLGEQAARVPDAVALVYEGVSLSYRELWRRAGRLARRLRALGVGPEVRVGICAERSLEMVVGLVAILRAGGAYVPLDPKYPRDRLTFMIEDAAVPVLLAQEQLAAELPAHPRVVVLEGDPEADREGESGELAGGAGSGNLAYVLYTSGSTGRPKGVGISHRALANYLTWAAEAYAVDQGWGAPVASSIGFDLTVTCLWTPLISGRSVLLLPEKGALEAFSRTLADGRDFSVAKMTPTHLQVLGELAARPPRPGRPHRLIVGGEALRGETLTAWGCHTPVVNEYGPTEGTVGCCVYTVAAGKHIKGAVPIGRPMANLRLHLLDRSLHPVPEGVPGQLMIGGEGLARGYLGRPALTAEAFVPDPLTATPGSGCTRAATGRAVWATVPSTTWAASTTR